MAEIPTLNQVSAGGVVYRRQAGELQVALISVGEKSRWQLPKGLIDSQEIPEAAAIREVREEAGVEAELLEFIDKIEYWYYSNQKGRRVRFHKKVYFYLLRYLSGDVKNHDQEVNEAAWFDVDQAVEQLAFDSEKEVVRKAVESIQKNN
jgi:8-oxo-dGTP diphosphatase